MVVLACIQGFVRADVALGLHAGILLVCMTRAGEELALPRAIQAVVSAISILLTGGIQYYLMRVVYPNATYQGTPVFQLFLNLTHPSVPFLLFIGPYAWTMWVILRKMRGQMRGPTAALGIGSAIFMGMWWTLGRIEEVRIFLPFALAISPTTVMAALWRFLPEHSS